MFAVLFTLPTMAEEEVVALVVDNGSGTCNTEFAGDDAPRVELPSIIDGPKTPGIMVDTEEKDSNVGHATRSGIRTSHVEPGALHRSAARVWLWSTMSLTKKTCHT